MRIGLVIGLHGTAAEGPRWETICAQAQAAEAVGFDLIVLEDALMAPDEQRPMGYWEAVAMAAAVAARTERIEIGHSVLNSPYRPASLTAKIADTLDEISGGRYVFGIGLGNTPLDYGPFGIDADRRYSRFADAIRVIHPLLKEGKASHVGQYHRADAAELVLRGPRPQGPPIVIAGQGPKMLRLVAEYADGWNWWTTTSDPEVLRPLVAELEAACREVGRDPASLTRSLDVYSIVPPGLRVATSEAAAFGGGRRTDAEIGDLLLQFRDLGFDEVRCDLEDPEGSTSLVERVEAMRGVVERVHAG
ncbi:MAG: LLM class flavin-dependent oxidoreductase [Chloroflexi bacterium]|nr:LLM class flavin-dependent oxidoreductase [Chloroflexota bacterium]